MTPNRAPLRYGLALSTSILPFFNGKPLFYKIISFTLRFKVLSIYLFFLTIYLKKKFKGNAKQDHQAF